MNIIDRESGTQSKMISSLKNILSKYEILTKLDGV